MKSFCYGSNRLSAHVQGSLLPLPPSPLWSAAYQLQQPLLCNPPSTPRGPAGNGLGSLCRQQAGAAVQLVSSMSQLLEVTADPPWPDAQVFHSRASYIWGCFKGILKLVARQIQSFFSTCVNRVCRDRTRKALPPWAGGRQVLLPGMVAMVLGVTVMELSHPPAPSSSSGYGEPSFQNVSQICLPCSVPFTGFILTQSISQRSL